MTKKILVVEDEKPLLKAIDRGLKQRGYDVFTARSVSQALEYLKRTDVDGIWLDHYLIGEASGLDFVMLLKEEKSKWKNIPVFVVSNTASPDKVKYYLELGVEQYHTKSNVRLDFLVEEMEKAINR